MIPVQRSKAVRYVACDLFACTSLRPARIQTRACDLLNCNATIVVSRFPLHGEAPIAFDPWGGRPFSGGGTWS